MSSSSRDSHGRGESKSSKYERTSEDSKHGDDESKLSEKFADMSSNGTLKRGSHRDTSSSTNTDGTLARGFSISEQMKEHNRELIRGSVPGQDSASSRLVEHRNTSDNSLSSRISGDGTGTMSSRGSSSTNRTNEAEGQITSMVLKFTTLSEATTEAPSFTVGIYGAKIGRDKENEVSIPSDSKLSRMCHAMIEFYNGSFYLIDKGFNSPASVRIGVGSHKRQWVMSMNSCFSAGNSAFRSGGLNEDGNLILEIIEGVQKGERRVVTKKGATIGRSSDNTICVTDRELSRRHTKVEFDEKTQRFFVCDIGSTNGTYMQLVGPYNGRFKLSLNDHILVGRTGFSLNRYDFGLSEERGYRPTMEDNNVIIQHLNINSYNANKYLTPQSFFGVFDGHGGDQASLFLSQKLHANVVAHLAKASPEVNRIFQDPDALICARYVPGSSSSSSYHHDLKRKATSISHAPVDNFDDLIVKTMKEAFLATDDDFIENSKTPAHGSTATTILMLGQRLYCANTGDSRTILCRNFNAVPLSEDHKPSREDEAIRIRAAGGFVINNRVMGELSVSRAFGDNEFKKGIQSILAEEVGEDQRHATDDNEEARSFSTQLREQDEIDMQNLDQPLIIADPELSMTCITEDDQFVLCACDGLYDVFTNQEIVNFVKKHLEVYGDPQRCCAHLTHEAIRKRNSRDNVSVILVILHKWW